MRRKVSENTEGNEGHSSKDARERQRKELGHTGVELFSSSICCSLVLHRRVSAIVTITRLSVKVSLKSLGQTEDSWFSSIHGKNTRLQKII